MKEGKLVPMATTIGLLKWAMLRSGGHTFLIDGFPRVRCSLIHCVLCVLFCSCYIFCTPIHAWQPAADIAIYLNSTSTYQADRQFRCFESARLPRHRHDASHRHATALACLLPKLCCATCLRRAVTCAAHHARGF